MAILLVKSFAEKKNICHWTKDTVKTIEGTSENL